MSESTGGIAIGLSFSCSAKVDFFEVQLLPQAASASASASCRVVNKQRCTSSVDNVILRFMTGKQVHNIECLLYSGQSTITAEPSGSGDDVAPSRARDSSMKSRDLRKRE